MQRKSAIITPVFKKGSRDLTSNYRPVSLTCVLCRVFEHIVADHLLYHLSLHNLISANQFGFLPGRYSCSQLLSVFNCWSHLLDTHEAFDVIYTDIAKAFDSVTHSKLLNVLLSYGIEGKVLDWINCFLYNRVQSVCINNCYSNSLPVLSGVPQGSVLGPLLFIIFINDAVKVTSLSGPFCGTFLYADDAKLFSNNPSQLQHALDCFSSRICEYQLCLAPAKCAHLAFS